MSSRAAGTSEEVRRLRRSVAIPTEHGGWGLTAEPVVLGLVLGWSAAGVAIGAAAFVAFLVRSPLKLALVDRRRGRDLARTRLARRVVAVESVVLLGLGALAWWSAGWTWLVPVGVALPLVAVELWFDVRSRSRRLVPELCGAVGIAEVAPAILLADSRSGAFAIAAWMILAGRSMASVPFVRAEVGRLHRAPVQVGPIVAFQFVGAGVAAGAVAVESAWWAGAVAVAIVAALQLRWLHSPFVPAAKVLGMRQLALGAGVVAAAFTGVVITG